MAVVDQETAGGTWQQVVAAANDGQGPDWACSIAFSHGVEFSNFRHWLSPSLGIPRRCHARRTLRCPLFSPAIQPRRTRQYILLRLLFLGS